MVSDQNLALHQREEIDRLADRFEHEFRAGSNPRIEEYLERQPELSRYLLRELLALEVELRQQAGDRPSAEDYQRRFSKDANIVAEVLSPALARTVNCQRNADDDGKEPRPEHLGRYALRRELGRGGFGVVYLAHDPQLDRLVALKMLRRKHFQTPEQIASFIAEARTAAKLKHPSLVMVHDVQEHDGLPYIVQEYIEGQNLDEWATANQPSFQQIARVMVGVAEALSYVHQQGLIHCDLKLANVLMDTSGRPHVADFGLAVHETVQALRKGEVFGTPATMAPEQVRGETHRLDGRTDIWAIGVMLYELLVGRRPFDAVSRAELCTEIQTHDPKPPRQIDRRVPRELERICLRCLSKRRTERYNTTDDLREDLLAWLGEEQPAKSPQSRTVANAAPAESSSGSKPPVKIIPRGLRSFDAGDADFFLELLPGPRDRDGLPESIRSWKSRIEETDPDKTFSVGVIYGPSGCGKSSLVKAGLLPRLCEDILPVYVEATSSDTELRILKRLGRHFPHLHAGNDPLPDVLAKLRLTGASHDRKVLLVLDQFEQWLHAHGGKDSSQLIDALRQCDGQRLQCIVMVRDDFWMAATRFMRELEVRLVEEVNSGSVDLFDEDHARKVLAAFGRAYGRLSEEATADQDAFLYESVSGLSRDGKVVCVRLSLFADMMKGRPWTPTVLRDVGGTEGIGVTFLEETFTASTAPPEHRLHQKAARAVLKALLPEAGTDIKGHMRSDKILLEASGYAAQPQEFVELMKILDSEVRLITPTDPEGIDSESESIPATDSGQSYYQLTHDYLVPSLRDWLTRKQRETRRGRAEMRLAERAALWNAKPENRHLPSLYEWARIRLLTDPVQWTDPQRRMMHTAARIRGTVWTVALVLLLGLLATVQAYVSARRTENERRQAELLVEALLGAPANAVPYALENLRPVEAHAVRILSRRFQEADTLAQRLRTAVALSEFGRDQHTFLVEHLESAPQQECANLVRALSHSAEEVLPELHRRAKNATAAEQWHEKARVAIVALHLGDATVVRDMVQPRPDPVQRTVVTTTLPNWHGPLDDWISAARANDDDALTASLCLGLGQLSTGNDGTPESTVAQAALTAWYVQRRSAAIHSAAGWALRQRAAPLPPVDPEAGKPDRGRWYTNSMGMTMVLIPSGTFVRQTPNRASDEVATEPQRVVLTKPFWCCDREVSRGHFLAFINDPNLRRSERPSGFEGARETRSPTLEHPVQQVSWEDSVLYCNWLSRQERLTVCYQRQGSQWTFDPSADGYRLLTEAEWEYACRAGTETPFSHGRDEAGLRNFAVVLSNSTAVCASRMPNPWGLFDMHGNVYEWCHDYYGSYGDAPQVIDPQGPPEGSRRVIRGGAFDYAPELARVDYRTNNQPAYRSFTIGFRVARNGTPEDVE